MNMLDLIMPVIAEGGGGGPQMIIFIGGFVVLMYLFMFRPQAKERKERQQMLDAVKKGDKIVTVGGIYGFVTNVKDKTVTVRIAENVKVEIARSGIAQILDSKEENKEENPQQQGQ